MPATPRDPAPLPGRLRLSGALLCGGLSRRMGRDKARLAWRGQPLLLRGLACLAESCEELLLAPGRSGRYRDLFPGPSGTPLPERFAGRSLREVPDRFESGADAPPGPLAGLEAVLAAAQGEWVWVTSCDLPLLDPRLGVELLDRAVSEDADVALCALPSGPGQALLPEPLCGVYRSGLWSACRAGLEAGERRVLAWAQQDWRPEGGPARRPRLTLLPLIGPRGQAVFNLNTPEDLCALDAAPAGRELSA